MCEHVESVQNGEFVVSFPERMIEEDSYAVKVVDVSRVWRVSLFLVVMIHCSQLVGTDCRKYEPGGARPTALIQIYASPGLLTNAKALERNKSLRGSHLPFSCGLACGELN